MISTFTRTSAVLAGVILLLSGCAGPTPGDPRIQTPIPAGSTLVLERSLELETGERRVFLQDGKVMREGLVAGMSRFRPRCSFRVQRVGDEELIDTIEPDRFKTGPAYRRAYATNWPEHGLQVAGLSLSAKQVSGTQGGPGFLTWVIEIPLTSSEQPQVRSFTCKVDRRVGLHRELGLEAVRKAGGGIVRIELAE